MFLLHPVYAVCRNMLLVANENSREENNEFQYQLGFELELELEFLQFGNNKQQNPFSSHKQIAFLYSHSHFHFHFHFHSKF